MNSQQIKTVIIGGAIIAILIYIWFYLQFHNEPVKKAQTSKAGDLYNYLNEIDYPQNVRDCLKLLFNTEEFENKYRGHLSEVEEFISNKTLGYLIGHFNLQLTDETIPTLRKLENYVSKLRLYNQDDKYLLKLKAGFLPTFTIYWQSNDGKEFKKNTFILDEVGIDYLISAIRKKRS